VVFGIQLTDRSIGRMADGDWRLTQPTFGSANAAQPSGEVRQLQINEWLAEASNSPDFIELYNADSLPVGLGGLFLTTLPPEDNGDIRLPRSALSREAATASSSPTAMTARSQPPRFQLAPEQGWIALLAEDLAPIDCVFYGPQTSNRSEGRQPSGAGSIASFGATHAGRGQPGIGRPGHDSPDRAPPGVPGPILALSSGRDRPWHRLAFRRL